MKKCPFCAEEIQDEAIKCKHCGEMLIASKKCQRCGTENTLDAFRCKNSDCSEIFSNSETNKDFATKIKEGAGCGPMVCSLVICGTGQMIKGQVGKGVLFFVLAILFGALTSFILYIGAIIVIIISVIDAANPVYKCSKCRVIVDSAAKKCKSCQSEFNN